MAALLCVFRILALMATLPAAVHAHHDAWPDDPFDARDEASPALRLDLPRQGGVDQGAQVDADGLRRDTYYFLGGQFLIIAALYYGPEELSGWNEQQKDEYSLNRYTSNIGDITVDSDRWWVNYALHPYWGGTYYVRARERGYDDDDAFWYSVLLSTLYEYGPEALFEQPSVQDLIFTPALGYFVGGYFMTLRAAMRAGVAAGRTSPMAEKTVRTLTDPLGAVSGLIDDAFDIDGTLAVAPFFVTEPLARLAGGVRTARATEPRLLPGMQLYLTW